MRSSSPISHYRCHKHPAGGLAPAESAQRGRAARKKLPRSAQQTLGLKNKGRGAFTPPAFRFITVGNLRHHPSTARRSLARPGVGDEMIRQRGWTRLRALRYAKRGFWGRAFESWGK
jgi:hypothetical protein